jgi:multimeric flavodoxin WrbA
MNCIILSGSRNPEGQTARAAAAVSEGVQAAGGACRTIFLPTMKIERCRQCGNDGWGKCRSEARCSIDDDFAPILADIVKADAVVFATPVYFSDLSESLRAFLDRLRRIARFDDNRAGIGQKPAAGVCVAGGGGGGAPQCSAILNGILATCGFDIVDMIPVRRQNLESKLPALQEMGRRLAGSGMEY